MGRHNLLLTGDAAIREMVDDTYYDAFVRAPETPMGSQIQIDILRRDLGQCGLLPDTIDELLHESHTKSVIGELAGDLHD